MGAILASTPLFAQQGETDQIKALQAQLARMQSQLDDLKRQVVAKDGAPTAARPVLAEAPVALIHEIGGGLSAYLDWAAHYALGSGGRAISVD